MQHRSRLTPEERLLESLMELDREVHHGGFAYFFQSNARRHAPAIVKNLRRIGAVRAARLCEQALEARRDREALDALDRRYFRCHEVEPKLWRFVQANRAGFALPVRKVRKRKAYGFTAECTAFEPRRRLWAALQVEPPASETLAQAMARAVLIAKELRIRTRAEDLEGAARAFLFAQSVKAGRWQECARQAGRAMALGGLQAGSAVMGWIIGLVEARRAEEADRRALSFLRLAERWLETEEEDPGEVAFQLGLWQAFLELPEMRLPRAMRRCARLMARVG